MNRIDRTIGWADYSWNPVVGCRRGCKYCYARRMNQRFKWIRYFNVPMFFPERLKEPSKIKKPSRIFVGSMTDLCWWENTWYRQVKSVIESNPQHTFMFLTKDPDQAYSGRLFTKNTMIGMTITGDNRDQILVGATDLYQYHTKCFVSIEPLLGIYTGYWLHTAIKLVIIGAMTGPGAIKPEPEWITHVLNNTTKKQRFWKNNIKPYLTGINIKPDAYVESLGTR